MKKVYNKNGWIRRERFPFLKDLINFIIMPIIAVVLIIWLGVITGRATLDFWSMQENKKIENEMKKREKEREQQRKQEEAMENQRKLDEAKERAKKEREDKNAIKFNRERDQALWGYINTIYPKGTYVLNKETMKKGKVIELQGERIILDTGWWFDYQYGEEPIEIIGYKEYRQYVKLMEKIK